MQILIFFAINITSINNFIYPTLINLTNILMSKLTRYIFNQIFVVILLSAFLLCLLVIFIQSVKFADLIINNGLPLAGFGKLLFFSIPKYLTFLLPIVVFAVTIFTYNKLISESEIVIMRAAGLSQVRLANAGIIASIVMVLFSYCLTLYLAPIAQHELRSLIFQARSQWGVALLREGDFTTIGKDVTIFIGERGRDNSLKEIFYHNTKTKSTIIAEKGTLIKTEDGPRLIVLNGSKQTVKDGKLHVITFKRSAVDIANKKKIEARWMEPQERFISQLFNHDDTSDMDIKYRTKLIAEGHRRIITPLLSLTLCLIAITAILITPYNRHGNLKQILTAIIIMIGIYTSNLWLFSITSANLNYIPIFYANVILPIFICLILIINPQSLIIHMNNIIIFMKLKAR